MSETQEPYWLVITRFDSSWEEEIDANAPPWARDSERYRHRLKRFTGEEVEEWRAGPAPKGAA